MDTPPTDPSRDWDMNSSGLEVDGIGYFISGAANGNGAGSVYQEAQATMLDYSGNLVWEKTYSANHSSGGHKYVAKKAIYDNATNEIFQMGNSSFSHQFFVNVFDASSGITDASKTIFFSSGLGANIQGFEIIESLDPANYCIAGFHRQHSWISEDDGPTNGTSQNGSPAFLLELEKASQTINWNQQYNIPSSGYNTNVDLFSAFTGQQPAIYTPQMVVAKSNGSGFVMSAVRKETGPTFDLEVLDLGVNGRNNCTNEDPQFSVIHVSYPDEFNLSVNFIAPTSQPGNLGDLPATSIYAACGSPETCEVNAEFTYNIKGCEVAFKDLSIGNTGECWEWDMGDGTIISGVQHPVYTYGASGTYTVCLTVCCKTPSGTFFYDTYCEDVTVNCGPPCQVPTLTDYFTTAATITNCFTREFTSVTASDPNLCYQWLVDGVPVGTSSTLNYTFPANGTYNVCLQTTCCFGLSILVTYCEDVVIDCCEIPQLLDYFNSKHSAQNCAKYKFQAVTNGNPDLCYNWTIDGVLVSTNPGFIHNFTANGTYVVCLEIYCCTDPTTSVTYCETYVIDCCQVPILTDYFTHKISPSNCFWYKFTDVINGNPDVCNRWTIDGVQVGAGNSISYVFPGDGVYEVCLEVYCCDDPSVSITYCETILIDCDLDACGCTVNNLLLNGDFEDTAIPVTSGIGINCTCSAGSVCVGTEPRDKCLNSLWIDDLWDNTLGTSAGHFLIVDGANGTIWSDNVAIAAGETYVFEFWNIREISDNATNNSTQMFDLVVNGTVIGSFNTAAAPSNQWTQYCADWVSNVSLFAAIIEIRQTAGNDFNDYGIDDIQFGKCLGSGMILAPEPEITVYPNPASLSLTVQWEGEIQTEVIKVYSLDGKLLKTVTVGLRNNVEIDVTDLTNGVYVLRAGTIAKRFVVAK
jgi:hypothetical protein